MDLKLNNTLSSLVSHWKIHEYNFDLEGTILIKSEYNFLRGRYIESAMIYEYAKTIQPDYFTLSPLLTNVKKKKIIVS